MLDFIFKIWYMIAILPFLLFIEANDMLVTYLKKRHIYWDMWYSILIFFLALFIILLIGVGL